ncbi:MAG TPA: PRC-barrel domain-containing protein [Capillimicrobium sp.]|nr:PRC-barrel domain-containing protein [Capillimicrobium sp.]
MDDLGPPTSYLALERGVDVYDAAGERIGTVDHVLADERVDVFDGLIVDTRELLGGHRFADADQVGELHERGVVLRVGRDRLHEPSENPAALRAEPEDAEASRLEARLRRAWDWISGNY